MKTRESLPRTTSSASRSGSVNGAEVNKQSDSIGEDQVVDLCIEDVDQERAPESNIITDADSTTQNFTLRGSSRNVSQPTRRSSQRSKKAPSVAAPYAAPVENGVTWVESPSPILESRLKDDLNIRTSSSGCRSRSSRSSKQQPTSTTTTYNNNNNNLKNNNNNNPHNLLLLSKEELRRDLRRSSLDDDNDSSSLTLIDGDVLEVPLRRAFSSSEVVHLEDRREKKAKVKLKDIPRDSSSPFPILTTLPNLEVQEEDKKRRKDDKKDDKNKKKKLKHLEEENLSKRLYESRDLLVPESRSNGLMCGSPQVVTIQPAPDSSFSSDVAPTTAEEDRRGVLRLKSCGECGARHAGGGCPFTRPTQRLPDSCPFPNNSTTPTQNGVIVAPPHRDPPTPPPITLDETWRDPQRPGSPTCYSRVSIPSCLSLEMRTVPPIEEPDPDDDVGVMGVTTIKPKQVEVVVATKLVAKFTQLGPVVGVPVREKDIPDDFSMINLWEVFGGEGKRYMSTVYPTRSNWTRFLRPAPDRESANLVVVPRQIRDPGDDICLLNHGEPCTQSVESVGGVAVFLVTTQDINVGDELVFWAHDPTLAWSRKKMEKTNCGGCNMRFTHPLFYRMHCSVFHDPNYSLTIRKYHCKVCGLAVLGKENIMRHAAEQHEGRGAYQCQFCKKFFLRLHSLDMHVTYSCGRNPARVFPLCDYCGKKFCQPQHLRSHQKRMHSDMAEVLREFQCKLCFKILGSRAALQRHLKEVHHKQDLSTGATCDRCGKMFQNKSNLKIHMLTHSGVKPFRCTESSCNAAFTTKQCLQFHYKKVHGYNGESIPKIERCIPYTFDSYSGGLVPDPNRGGKMHPHMLDTSSTSSNSPEALTQIQVDELQNDSISQTDDDESIEPLPILKSPSPPPLSRSPELILSSTKLPPAATLHGYVAKYAAAATRLVSKGSRKWLGDSLESLDRDHDGPAPNTPRDIYAFDDRLDSDLLQRRKDKCDNEFEEDKILFRRESNASLLVEAALNVAESNLKGEPRSVGTHDRLLSYAGGGNGTAITRYSPTPSVSSSVDHLLPQDTVLSTHIKYTTSVDDDRGHLEYTLEREYDPRDLPEVMVVHDGMSSRDLNDSLTSDLQEHLHSTLEHLPPDSVGDPDLHGVRSVHNLSLAKTEDLPPATPATPSDSIVSLSSSNGLEPNLHVLDQLPVVTHGMPVSLPSPLTIGLDMTYKHYRLVPESSLSVPSEHLLGTQMEDAEGSIGLETITSTGVVTCHQLSPRNDHLSDQLPLPELQPHDFRGLPSIRSPEPSRSPYLSPSHTPEEALRSYLVSTDGLRSPHSNEHGIDMSRSNVLIRSGDLTSITYRYQGSDSIGTSRAQIYEIERPSSQSIDLSVVGRTISYTDVSRSNIGTTVYLTEARPGSGGSTVYLTDQRDDFRHTLDLTIPRSDESLSRVGSPVTFTRSDSPQISPHHQLSPMNQLSPCSQLPPYSQLSPHNHSHFSPLPQITTLERVDAMSPDLLTRENLGSESPGPSSSVSPSIGAPLPPISRIVTSSPHSFYSTRQLLSRQDISLPTHIYTESYMITNGSTSDALPPTPTPPPSSSNTDKGRPSSPYLQYPTSPYPRHQEVASPPPGFHYQYY